MSAWKRFTLTARTARRTAVVALLMTGLLGGMAPAADGAFGLSRFEVAFHNENGSSATTSGGHPYSLSADLAFNASFSSRFNKTLPDDAVKDVQLRLPAGFAGDVVGIPRCTNEDFLETDGNEHPECPNDTAVGISEIALEAGERGGPVYNLTPSPGTVAKLGFYALTIPVTIDVGVDRGAPFQVESNLRGISQATEIFSAHLEIWGDPASSVHDPFRGKCVGLGLDSENNSTLVSKGICPTDAPEVPFLTLPTSCGHPLDSTYAADSWEAPGATRPDGFPDLSDPAWVSGSYQAPAVTGCQELGFGPTIEAGSSAHGGEAPSGLDFDLKVDDPGLMDPEGRADSAIEKTVVTLPEGFTTNPSVANGLEACSLARYEADELEFDPQKGCPDASMVGTVEVISPVIEQHLQGQIYVARQHENPFGSLLALYMIIRNEELGVLIKQPIEVEPDPTTGRLTTTVSEIPQLPFSDFHLHFFEGSRAPLLTPAVCGTYQAQADLYPYAEGVAPVHRTADLTVSSACASSPGARPNSPGFSAGTKNSAAGAYSPFVLSLSRPDGSQQLSKIVTTLPQGLLGKLQGIPYCPQSGIAQAESRGDEGQGAVELSSPSCPAASQLGTVTATSGAGAEPLTVTGKVYLAGPYKAAPLSLEIVTPAIAGPFDLGVVAVRTALRVDPITAQITAESDPIPTILHGLPLVLRSISIDTDRPSFTLNPTSCEPKAITGSAISTLGAVAPLSQYFQASDCAALKFKPTLALSLKGQTRRAGHPSLHAVLTYPKSGAYANIARAQVGLPGSEFLDQGSIAKACIRPLLLEGACPKKSIYGKAKAWSPLLEAPLSGPVYLVGGFGYKLPALVAELDGQIRVLLVGKVDTGKNRGIRNTFETVPDAPVSKFELTLKGGPKYGLLENSEDLCKKSQKAQTTFVGQSGVRDNTAVTIRNACRQKQPRGSATGKGARQQKIDR